MKKCPTCGIEKEISEFHNSKRSKDGHNRECKNCIHNYNTSPGRQAVGRVYNKKRLEREEYRNYLKNYLAGYYQTNKNKLKETRKEWLSIPANQNKMTEYKRKFKATSKGKAATLRYKHSKAGREFFRRNRAMRRAGGYVSSSEWDEIIKSSNGMCLLCGNVTDKFHIDHWVPVARGGKTELGNLIPLCSKCNHKKSDHDPVEFIKDNFGLDTLERVVKFLEAYQ